MGILGPVSSRNVLGQRAEQDGVDRFVHWAYHDATDWLTTWNTTRIARVGLATAALVPLSFLDEPISREVRHTASGVPDWILDHANSMGDPGAVVLPAGVFGLSLLGRDRKFQDAAFTSLQSYLYSNALVMGLKVAVGRSRPDAVDDAYVFHPFSGASAFPSGHTSSAVAMVMPWVFYYPGMPAYVLAAVAVGTGAARVEKGKHWVTDVMASMAIGTAMSWWLVRRHRGQAPTGLTVEPSFGSGSVSLTMRVAL